MYKTIEETAIDLGMPVDQVMRLIYEGRIRSVYDGQQILINSGQFSTYFNQLERIKEEIEIWRSTLFQRILMSKMKIKSPPFIQ